MISLQQSLVQKENIYSSHIIPPTKLRIKIQSLCQEVSYARYRKPEIWCIRLAYVPNIFFHLKCYIRMRGSKCELKFQILPNIIRVQNSTKTCTENLQKQEKKKKCICKSLKKISNVKYHLWALWHFYFCKITIYIQFKTTMILLLKQ